MLKDMQGAVSETSEYEKMLFPIVCHYFMVIMLNVRPATFVLRNYAQYAINREPV